MAIRPRPTPPANKLPPPSNNESFIGTSQDDNFTGGTGNDRFAGGGGYDTVDYSSLRGPITLLASGVISKGALGTDAIDGIERIIGKAGAANLIDGEVAGPQVTSFVVDLGASTLTVNGIPGLGSANFSVVNFTNVRGTDNADIISGSSANNVFFGSYGNDIYDGRDGIDVIDYSGLGAAVTLTSRGLISKGTLGADTISNMEFIIGAAGLKNTIDGTVSTPSSQTTSFNIDLSSKTLVVNGIPGLGTASFTVVNFVDVVGTNNSDIVIGDNSNNSIFGAAGNDALYGGAGNDVLVGGAGTDTLTLGSGKDSVRFLSLSEGGDIINDFLARDDNFEMSSAVFGLPQGAIKRDGFAANVNGVATEARAQFVYDTDGGAVYFDADGTGAGQAVLLATLIGAPVLSAADFIIIA